MLSVIKRQLKIPAVLITTLITFFSFKSVKNYTSYIWKHKVTKHSFQFLKLSTKSDPIYKLKLILVCLLIFINQIPLATIQLSTIFEQMGKTISSEDKFVKIIDDIYEKEIISEADQNYLTDLRKQRNLFIHESEGDFNKTNSLETLAKTTVVFEKLHSHLQQSNPPKEEIISEKSKIQTS